MIPRDLIGYGQTPPNPRWPNNARVAVQIVLNYEEGGENSVLNGDKGSEAFLSEMVGAQSHPARAMAMERNPAAVEAMARADWEIASHGYRWIDYQTVPEEIEREHIAKAIQLHTR